MASFSPILYSHDAKAFEECLNALNVETLPSFIEFELESRYRSAELGEGFQDLSFCVVNGKNVVAAVLAHKLDVCLGFNGSGVKIYSLTENKKLIRMCLDFLFGMAQEQQSQIIKVDDLMLSNHLSVLGQEAFNRRGTPYIKLRAVQNLQQSEDIIHRDLRQSYKALVNQGKREIQFSYVTKENLDEEAFASFKQFHKDVAGRQTRPTESWDVQFDMIEAGVAELIMGYMHPHGLVSSALFTDYGSTTSYAVAVYNRDLFEKPLAHANVYEGMIRAKERGQISFNLGVIPSYAPEKEKEYNIGKFKKGFCRELSPFIEWAIPVT